MGKKSFFFFVVVVFHASLSKGTGTARSYGPGKGKCLSWSSLRLNCCRNCLVGVDRGGRVYGVKRICLIFTFCFEHCIKEEVFANSCKVRLFCRLHRSENVPDKFLKKIHDKVPLPFSGLNRQ